MILYQTSVTNIFLPFLFLMTL